MFSKDETEMAKKHLIKKSSTSLATREMEIKTTIRFHVTPMRMAKINKQMTALYGEDAG